MKGVINFINTLSAISALNTKDDLIFFIYLCIPIRIIRSLIHTCAIKRRSKGHAFLMRLLTIMLTSNLIRFHF